MKSFFFSPHSQGAFPPDDLMEWGEPTPKVPWRSWFGLAVILISEIFLFFQIEPVYTHFTLIVWWGYILLLDGFIKHRRGVSWLADKPLFFIYLSMISAFWWLVFEFYNCYLENWVYIGVPSSIVYRYFCYLLAYATITPAILLTYLFALTYWPSHESLDFSRRPRAAVCYSWLFFGVLCVSIPLLIPQREIRHYLFGFVWVGYVFMLEPISYWSGGYSLLRLWAAGARRTVWLMFGSGAVCGLLWEFWNYWAGAKWLYTVPIFPSVRYFEMPIIGFLGFFPFAWECLMLVMFSSLILNRLPFQSNRHVSSKRFVIISRCLFTGLIGLFAATYLLQPKFFFPIQDFDPFWKKATNLDHNEWASSYRRDFLPLYLDLFQNGHEPSKNELDNIFPNGTLLVYGSHPYIHTQENLRRLADQQKLQGQWKFIDPLLRGYAMASRFNWAIHRNWPKYRDEFDLSR